MTSPMITNHEVSLLFALRTRTVRNVANNFGQDKTCSLGCAAPDIQDHWIICRKTLANQGTLVEYSDIYGGLIKQVEIVKLYAKLEQEREELSNREAPSSPVAVITGPWSLGRDIAYVQMCIP